MYSCNTSNLRNSAFTMGNKILKIISITEITLNDILTEVYQNSYNRYLEDDFGDFYAKEGKTLLRIRTKIVDESFDTRVIQSVNLMSNLKQLDIKFLQFTSHCFTLSSVNSNLKSNRNSKTITLGNKDYLLSKIQSTQTQVKDFLDLTFLYENASKPFTSLTFSVDCVMVNGIKLPHYAKVLEATNSSLTLSLKEEFVIETLSSEIATTLQSLAA